VPDKNEPNRRAWLRIRRCKLCKTLEFLFGCLRIGDEVDRAHAKAVLKEAFPVTAVRRGAVDVGQEDVVFDGHHDGNVVRSGFLERGRLIQQRVA